MQARNHEYKPIQLANGRALQGNSETDLTREIKTTRRITVTNELREMEVGWENVTAAAEDRQRQRERLIDAERIKVKVKAYTQRASSGIHIQ